ncbi:hypothetical protein ABNG02_14560 [Halorubrum ejinorense]|uniref:DUF2391 domain-containing protein n=1 Tax=Halorubrum ejinorense TaxID=425309 RepID=A0AAV3SR76_9EURY
MARTESSRIDRDADIDDVLTELDELEDIVDRDEELQQVRETMQTARQVRRRGIIGRFQSQFGPRDAGEALVGSFVFGMPMIVEDGALEIGRFIAKRPPVLLLTLLFGGTLVFGILHAGEFEQVVEDRLFGVVPLRPVAIMCIAGGLAIVLMTGWGRVAWSEPLIAGGQTVLIGVVMSVGASIGDILPEN